MSWQDDEKACATLVVRAFFLEVKIKHQNILDFIISLLIIVNRSEDIPSNRTIV